jgi:hypothetical protein
MSSFLFTNTILLTYIAEILIEVEIRAFVAEYNNFLYFFFTLSSVF